MRRLKKYGSGQGAQYITRRRAIRKLQLSLKDFRRLCIIKGIYPREPKNRRKAQKGANDIKILYHTKDIKFLLHEPIVQTLRDNKAYFRKLSKDHALKDFQNLKRRLQNKPELKIDHVVKERYPTFIDAIKDLDDCLTLIFLFSTFPSIPTLPRDQSALCRRLSIEFMHLVIAGKFLRKVFISIKGYYFQAEIKGQKVTWIIPHYYPFQPQKKSEVDFKLMSIFVEFYSIMLGFVNFRLYNSLNLIYPPTFPDTITETNLEKLKDEQEFVSERIAALNIDLKKIDPTQNEEEDENFDFDLLSTEGESAKVMELKEEMQKNKKLKTLFKGLKFFINREVPREPVVFIIRCFGGEVSWDKKLFCGATFDETDELITHQIIDRPIIGDKYISRDYIQPQWIFDCVNSVELLPTNKYFPGVDLPPHLSPFFDYEIDNEEKEFDVKDKEENNSVKKNETNELDMKLEMAYTEEQKEEPKSKSKNKKKDKQEKDNKQSNNMEFEIIDEKEKLINAKKKKMGVVTGKVYKENPKEQIISDAQERNLQAKMVKGRHRFLFKKLVRERREKRKEDHILQMKRKELKTKSQKA